MQVSLKSTLISMALYLNSTKLQIYEITRKNALLRLLWTNREYGGLRVDQAKRLKELEQENGRLKKIVADLSLDNSILKDVLHIDHTRHRSPMNFVTNLVAGLAAYMLYPNKPKMRNDFHATEGIALVAA